MPSATLSLLSIRFGRILSVPTGSDALKRLVLLGLAALALQVLVIHVVRAAEVPTCDKAQLLGYAPAEDEVTVHRQFAVPAVRYPFGAQRPIWGLVVTVRVDAAGHVACYVASSPWPGRGDGEALNDMQRAAIAEFATWRYAPFVQGGKPTAAILSESIAEEEIPKRHLPLPDVPLDRVHITLSRSACFGSCPSYKVDIHGNGRVVYRGEGFVDVMGEHHYTVPVGDVARLVESLRVKDLWSLRPAYRADITDNPTFELTMAIGDQVHHIEDYMGQKVGMPAAVSEFESEVDKIAKTGMWVNLTEEGVEHLQKEGFDFRSAPGADLLARTVANDRSRDDQALLRLIEFGAPLDGDGNVDVGFRRKLGSVMEEALRRHRSILIAPLIARGALSVDGKPDQYRIDAAFRAAIAGGRLASLQTIWNIRGDRPHPSLTFEDISEDGRQEESPVTLLLSRQSYPPDAGWEGLAIAKWLATKGCDLKATAADGRTLLHIAAEANDADFVRYLLAQGFDPSAPGEYGLPALGSTTDEEVAMILLQAGTDFSRMLDAGHQFRRYAESNHWQRVVAWLTAHHES
jgi:hypothetical protein